MSYAKCKRTLTRRSGEVGGFSVIFVIDVIGVVRHVKSAISCVMFVILYIICYITAAPEVTASLPEVARQFRLTQQLVA